MLKRVPLSHITKYSGSTLKPSGLQALRKDWLFHGNLPMTSAGFPISEVIVKSWQRCVKSGLDAFKKTPSSDYLLSNDLLKTKREQREVLINTVSPTMNYLHQLMYGTGSVVVFADRQGVILHSVGDADFLDKANRVLLKPGASWLESHRGTNAIGTAIQEKNAVVVHGGEHYLETNTFLSCAAAPIFDPVGAIAGVLDVSCHSEVFHLHTIGLVKATIHSIEKQLFMQQESKYFMTICVHPLVSGLGSIAEGVLGVDERGYIVGIDRAAIAYLGINDLDIGQIRLSQVLDVDFDGLIDQSRKQSITTIQVKTFKGVALYLAVKISKEISTIFSNQSSSSLNKLTDDQAELISNLKSVSAKTAEDAVKATKGNISKAAKSLGISRGTLYKYLGSKK